MRAGHGEVGVTDHGELWLATNIGTEYCPPYKNGSVEGSEGGYRGGTKSEIKCLSSLAAYCGASYRFP
jgi:hypothetical protein